MFGCLLYSKGVQVHYQVQPTLSKMKEITSCQLLVFLSVCYLNSISVFYLWQNIKICLVKVGYLMQFLALHLLPLLYLVNFNLEST